MHQTDEKNGTSNFLDRTQLLKLKTRAMRAGVWFRSLPRIDRVLVELTIKVTESVRSPYLAKSLLAIAGKLEGLLESKLKRAVREIGLPIAYKLSLFAQKWGNKAAREWTSDQDFACYWAVMKLNGHPCSG